MYIFTCLNSSQMMELINDYFVQVKGEPQINEQTGAPGKGWLREPEAPTLSGLLLFLGFESTADFDLYTQKPRYRKALRYARLRIEAAYEQQLFDKTAGAIFALKNMGWTDKPPIKTDTNNTLKVEITASGPLPAGTEKEVMV